MEVLITGGKGQLGHYLVKELLKEYSDINIIIIDNLTNAKSHLDHQSVEVIEANFEDPTTYSHPILQNASIDTIFHLAAQISVPESIRNPVSDFQINGLGTLKLLKWAKDNNINNFITIGSAATLGHPLHLPISTDHPQHPISPYGISKMTAEQYTTYFRDHYGLNFKVIRPFNIYSEIMKPNDPYSGVISKFIEFAKNREEFIIEGDGLQTRDFIHAEDVAKILVRSIHDTKKSIYNAATGVGTTILDLSKIIASIAGIPWRVRHVSPRPGDIKHSFGEKSELMDFDAIPLQIGLKQVYEIHNH